MYRRIESFMATMMSGVALICVCAAAPTHAADFPLLLVAADDTGDFGPETPGTKTSGIQEALDFCAENMKDLFIKEGVYDVSETIQVLPVNDFLIDAGDATLNWTGPADKDLLWINSGLDAHYWFGTLIYDGSAAALHILPIGTGRLNGKRTRRSSTARTAVRCAEISAAS